MSKFFDVPFATSGDRTVTPDPIQGDGSVSYTEGFGFDYERADTDPNYKPIPRQGFNGLLYDLTESVGLVQRQGFDDWRSGLAGGYAANAWVRHNGEVWRSVTGSNTGEPGVSANWENTAIPQNLLDSVRVNVASGTTVNLDSLAPNTRHINLTGTSTITAFTITAGRCYFVRAAAGCVLANSANLTTQRGTAITCAAGDTFILRATATNVVEVLCYTEAAPAQLGVGQIWQDVTGTRTAGVTYTNTTGRPIMVYVQSTSATSSNSISITIGGVTLSGNATGPSVNSSSVVQGIVPTGATYVVGTGRSVANWLELR